MLILLSLPLGCIHVQPVTPPDLQHDAHHFVLKNGLSVIIDPVPGHGEIVSRLHYSVGEGELTSEESGLAHLTEHLMFEGSAHVANGEYDRLLNASGGESSAYTTHDSVVFTARFPSNALERVLFLESDRMGWLCEGLSEEDILNQKEVVNQETLRDLSNFRTRSGLILRSMIFNNTPLSRDPGGDYLQIEQHDLNAVCQFSRRWIRPDNAILTLSGTMDPKMAEVWVRRWFSDVTANQNIDLNHTTWLDAYIDAHQDIDTRGPFSEILVGWPTVPKGHPDSIPLNLIMDLLAHPADGILTESRIKADGLVNYTRMGGWFSLRLSGWSHHRLLAELDDALKHLRQLPPHRLKLFHYRRRAAYIRAWGDLKTRAKLLSACVELNQDTDCIQRQINREFLIKNSEIDAAIQDWLTDYRRFVIRVSPDFQKGAMK